MTEILRTLRIRTTSLQFAETLSHAGTYGVAPGHDTGVLIATSQRRAREAINCEHQVQFEVEFLLSLGLEYFDIVLGMVGLQCFCQPLVRAPTTSVTTRSASAFSVSLCGDRIISQKCGQCAI